MRTALLMVVALGGCSGHMLEAISVTRADPQLRVRVRSDVEPMHVPSARADDFLREPPAAAPPCVPPADCTFVRSL